MNRPPTVSVVIPNFNHGPFLVQRIESVLQQTFADIEVIILDDASTDNSEEVIARYLSNARVTYYRNARNSGSPFIQWNRGVELAHGDLVWIAESDDFAAPELLATLVAMLQSNPTVGLAYCQSWRVDSNGTIQGSLGETKEALLEKRWQRSFINAGRDECARLVWQNSIPNASAVVFRRDLFLRAGGAPTDMRLAGDWLTWARMLMICDIAFTPACLNFFRHHSATARATSSWRIFFDERWTVQRMLICAGVVPRAVQREIARTIANEYLSRVRLATQGSWSELIAGVTQFWPILLRAPGTVLGVLIMRGRRKLARKSSGSWRHRGF
jgi:glycosyltransferase involved in cell wall biosynthesis